MTPQSNIIKLNRHCRKIEDVLRRTRRTRSSTQTVYFAKDELKSLENVLRLSRDIGKSIPDEVA